MNRFPFEYIFKCNLFLCWQIWIFSIIIQFSVSHDPSEIILICWCTAKSNILYYYQCWKQMCCSTFLKKPWPFFPDFFNDFKNHIYFWPIKCTIACTWKKKILSYFQKNKKIKIIKMILTPNFWTIVNIYLIIYYKKMTLYINLFIDWFIFSFNTKVTY